MWTMVKIQKTTYNLLDDVHRWWCKIKQDKAEPASWKDFEVIFYNNFVSPYESTWFFLSQRNYSVQEYANKLKGPRTEHILGSCKLISLLNLSFPLNKSILNREIGKRT